MIEQRGGGGRIAGCGEEGGVKKNGRDGGLFKQVGRDGQGPGEEGKVF